MLWALSSDNGKRIQATPFDRAECPSCRRQVIAKCGEIVSWHWAHRNDECDPWHESESVWHIKWKERFPSTWQEVVIGSHRADIQTSQGIVIELQASSISAREIREREEFYENMVWLIRGADFHFRLRQRDGFLSFRWLWPAKTWWMATKPIFVDFCRDRPVWDADVAIDAAPATGRLFINNQRTLFQIKKLHHSVPCGGWGRRVREESFMQLMTARSREEIHCGQRMGSYGRNFY